MRTGNFTSSTIVALTGNGKRKMTADELKARPKEGAGSSAKLIEDINLLSDAAKTYIQECNWERRTGRSFDGENTSKPTSWGKLCEMYVQSNHEIVGIQYEQRSDEPLQHPDFEYWWGTPDMLDEETVCDIKSPFTLKSFCQLVQPIYDGLIGMGAMNAIRKGYTDSKGVEHDKHPDGEKYYWQLVSNSIITKRTYAELWIFCPYKDELQDIRDLAQSTGNPNYYFIGNSIDEDLPYLLKGGYYQNRNIIRFEVPQADKDYLTTKCVKAAELLDPVKVEA